jgi:hypothetical protein
LAASSIFKQVTAIFTQKRLGVCLPGRITCVLNGQPSAYASVDVADKLEQRVLVSCTGDPCKKSSD